MVTFDPAAVANLRLPQESQAFLTMIGLPKDAAPFLGFGGASELMLPDAVDVWKHGKRGYRMIGSTGFGDPICLAEKDGRIVYLNHDDEMRDEFMNSSLLQLAYSLLAFRSAVQSAIDVGGDDAYLDNRIPNEVVERFIGEMDRIDPEAIKAERFWLRSILGDGV